MLLDLEGFTYASSLDLNMGYYHIELTSRAKQIYTILIRWSKCEYQKLPMGVCNSPYFQENISKLFEGFDMVCAYINEVIVINKNNSKDNIKSL